MKTRPAQIITVILSVFASFVVYLCVSMADIAPMILFVILAAASVLILEGRINRPFTAIKLSTQKRE